MKFQTHLKGYCALGVLAVLLTGCAGMTPVVATTPPASVSGTATAPAFGNVLVDVLRIVPAVLTDLAAFATGAVL
jgi:hypothetical protein